MFKLLSINRLLSHNFYHKAQGCNYSFKKVIGKSFLFMELNPQNTYQKRELHLSLEQLLNSQEVELLKEEKCTPIPIYNYFENQYINIKDKINMVKSTGDLKELLADIDPFLYPEDMLTDTHEIKLSKKELSNLLEDDWQKLSNLRKGQVSGIGPQAESSDLYPLHELRELKPTLIALKSNSDKHQSAPLMEEIYLRSEITINKGLKDNILPFLALITSDYINNRIFTWASEMESVPPKVHCQVETVDSIAPNIAEIFHSPKAAIVEFNQDTGSFVLALMGIYGKIDKQNILVKIKIDLPEKNLIKTKSLFKRIKLERKLTKFLLSGDLYSEIYYELSDFLSHKSYRIQNSSSIKREIKKKLDNLLKPPNISENYKKLLPALSKSEIHFLLTILVDRKSDKIKEIILITIQYQLKETATSENFYSGFNFIKSLQSYADSAKLTFKESDWEGIVSDIKSLIPSSGIDHKLFFLILEVLFEGSIFLTTYQKFSEIEASGASSEDEYISLCLRLFDHHNWVEQDGRYTALNLHTRNAVINFLLQEAQYRLKNPDNIEALKQVRAILSKLDLDLTAEVLKPFIVNIRNEAIKEGSLVSSIEKVSNYFEALEIFFTDLPHLVTYKEFSQIYTPGKRFSGYEYVTIGLMIFNDDNWLKDKTKSLALNGETKDIIKKFVVQQMANLLPDAKNQQKISQNRMILEKMDILIAPADIEPLIAAIEGSALIDNQQRQIKNGQDIQSYVDILMEFLSGTNILIYYNIFANVKLGQYNFSDFYYVTIGLKILNRRNWSHKLLSEEIRQGIKQLYFNTFLSPKLSRDDKISNLHILHNQLKITITKEEKAELSKHLKDRIEGLVDSLDTMEELVVAATK